MGIEESVIFQEILQKGEARGEARGLSQGALDEARRMVLKLGRKRFGAPPAQAKAALTGITDVAELERLHDKLLDVHQLGRIARLAARQA
jgi:predicted transposase YdaD